MKKSILDDPRQFFCVSVHMGKHTLPVDCSFTTRDMVTGSVSIHVEYEVSDPESLVIGTDDALASLSTRCREAVTDLTEHLAYTDISIRQIRSIVEGVETHDLGLIITRALIPGPISWPSDITEPRRDIPRILEESERDKIAQKAKLTSEKELARLLEEKLSNMGISHPAVLMRVLSRHDADYQAILDAAQHVSDEKRSKEEQAKELLLWLVEKDKVPRSDLDTLVKTLSGRVTSDAESLPDAVLGILTAPPSPDSLPPSSAELEGNKSEHTRTEQGSGKLKGTLLEQNENKNVNESGTNQQADAEQ